MRLRTLVIVLIGGLLGFATVAAGFAFFPRSYEFVGTVFDPAKPAYDFSLQQADGTSFRITDEAGKVVLLFFGYTNCPDVCPVTLNDFRKVEEALGEEADQLDLVMVTVDPARDTPDVMRDYVSRFSPSIIGLSGSEKELTEIWKGYFVYRALDTAADSATGTGQEGTAGQEGYLVDHTARVYAVDKRGNLRLSFPFGVGADTIAADVRQLIHEQD